MTGRLRAGMVVGSSVAALFLVSCGGSPPQNRAPVVHQNRHSTTTTASGFVAQSSSVPQATVSDGRSDCGNMTIDKPTGARWVCSFDDEFDGSTLSTSRWDVQDTALTGYRSGDECYLNSPGTVSVSGGVLNLTAHRAPSPFTCQSPVGSYPTRYTSGMVTTYLKFSQTYGYFEVKAAFAPTAVSGIQSSLWLWPVNRNAYGRTFPDSGEIDFAEWFSSDPTLAIPTIHYNAVDGTDPNATTNSCHVTDPSVFNTYGVEWTPDSMTILIDGRTCMVDDWSPAAPERSPAPFNLPFFLNLTQAIGVGDNEVSSRTPFPATLRVDWVRVWR